MFLLGAVEGEGILLNPNEILELSYSWGIGEDIKNIAEELALWQGLYQANPGILLKSMLLETPKL